MVKKWQYIPLIFLLLFTGCVSEEAQELAPMLQSSKVATDTSNTWIRTFEGPGYGAFLDIVLTQDGNVLAVGATNHLHVPPYSGDALIMKLTLSGDVLWERTWGGDGYEQAVSVVLDGDGGYYIFGETDSYGRRRPGFFPSQDQRRWHREVVQDIRQNRQRVAVRDASAFERGTTDLWTH